MDVGATLRHARTRKGLTLQQLSRATKISVSQLGALENNDFDRLPATIYTRGFLRAYAREVELDPEEIVDEYLRQVEDELATQQAEAEVVKEATPDAEVGSADRFGGRVFNIPIPRLTAAASRSEPRVFNITVPRLSMPTVAGVIAALLLGSYVGVALRTRHRSEPVATSASPQQVASGGVGDSPVTDAAHAANVVPDNLRVALKVTGPCWISATADRTPVFARLLQAGEDQSFDAKDELILRVGDPSTVALSINGVPARPIGTPRQAVTVQINKQNYREFLVP